MAAAPEPVDWIAAYARVQRVADREVIALLRQAIRDINPYLDRLGSAQNIGSQVRAEQFRTVRQTLLREQAKLLRKVGDVVNARRLEAASRAVKLGGAIDLALFSRAGFASVGEQLVRSFSEGMRHTLDVALTRVQASQIPLSQQVYQTTVASNGILQRKINSALARGLSAREFASEIREYVSPNTPGGARYASMRLARTEINNAFHAMSAMDIADKPWVNAGQWHLSGSHPKADDCDKLAKDDQFDLGPGVYPKDGIPKKPHPQCLCYITPVVEDDDAFLDALVGGKYDSYLHRRLGQSSFTS